ncbi:hypothetical protein C7H19_12630 [Aphanothece hegewaldii CCALA 016]|uniref:Type II toxin-antitoxin system HicA family toxin n=1 Tax=Aphanothece hegewaldii CCALA 016 TaxID=2107694 RepID=A0A2T1LX96_9CHRO|nr:type II toxin-antitoxin system HicA family toxin [Aphanothece hegewaldii]PSF36807.1 hypothetical protein C7H19_12630 [Aphanothece hegewaldii CCALA 016]
MKNKNIIYNQLEELLFSLGFIPVETKGNHKVYSHPNSKALILLPNYQSTDRLNLVHYLAIRRTLKEYDLMDEMTYENWFDTKIKIYQNQ